MSDGALPFCLLSPVPAPGAGRNAPWGELRSLVSSLIPEIDPGAFISQKNDYLLR